MNNESWLDDALRVMIVAAICTTFPVVTTVVLWGGGGLGVALVVAVGMTVAVRTIAKAATKDANKKDQT